MEKKLKIVDKLRSSGLRPTKQRIQIADFLFQREKTFHFTVEEIDKLINKKNINEKISLATFYNTVHAFKKAGHLKEILTNNNKSYFDTNTSSHHHFFDIEQNELTDIEFQNIKLDKIPSPPPGKSIKDVDVVINITRSKNK
ncbi:MAG: Fur family transcriptional regulator, iron response regulator [Pelagibacterales bacterium]|nr:Fur family transcriptional regulator, iron response regulator [Pelagibacterales bacterium]